VDDSKGGGGPLGNLKIADIEADTRPIRPDIIVSISRHFAKHFGLENGENENEN